MFLVFVNENGATGPRGKRTEIARATFALFCFENKADDGMAIAVRYPRLRCIFVAKRVLQFTSLHKALVHGPV